MLRGAGCSTARTEASQRKLGGRGRAAELRGEGDGEGKGLISLQIFFFFVMFFLLFSTFLSLSYTRLGVCRARTSRPARRLLIDCCHTILLLRLNCKSSEMTHFPKRSLALAFIAMIECEYRMKSPAVISLFHVSLTECVCIKERIHAYSGGSNVISSNDVS